MIAFTYFADLAVPRKGVGLANMANNSVDPGLPKGLLMFSIGDTIRKT
jgi:hypothetical protein